MVRTKFGMAASSSTTPVRLLADSLTLSTLTTAQNRRTIVVDAGKSLCAAPQNKTAKSLTEFQTTRPCFTRWG
jgi:hypothetical protein